jgi:hypothetical protein
MLLSPSHPVSLQDAGRFKERVINKDLLMEDLFYQQLFHHTWNIYKVTPLYRFQKDDEPLNYYMKCLDKHLKEEMQSEALWESDDDDLEMSKNGGPTTPIQSRFIFREWPEWNMKLLSIEIHYQKSQKQEEAGNTFVSTCYAVLLSVGNELLSSSSSEETMKQFTQFPLLFVRGSIRLTRILLDFIESHFDCRTSHFKLQPVELSWLLCEWMPGMMIGKQHDMRPLELTLSVPSSVPELKHIVVTIPTESLQRLTKAMEGDVTVNDVMGLLESHLKDVFRLNVSRLHLIRIGTSLAYVGGPEAKLKLLDKTPVCGVAVLQTLCQLATHTFRL